MNPQFIFPMIYEFVITALILPLDVKMFKKLRENKTNTVKYMLFFSLGMTIAILFAAISRIIRVFVWDLTPGVANIELLSVAVAFIGFGNIFCLAFILEVFFNGVSADNNRNYIIIYSVIAVVNAIFSISTGIYVQDLTIYIWLFIIAISIVIYIIMIRSALKLAKKISDPLAKLSTQMIGISGISILLTFVFFMVDNGLGGNFTPFYYLAWSCVLLSLGFMYIGVMQPLWFKKKYSKTADN